MVPRSAWSSLLTRHYSATRFGSPAGMCIPIETVVDARIDDRAHAIGHCTGWSLVLLACRITPQRFGRSSSCMKMPQGIRRMQTSTTSTERGAGVGIQISDLHIHTALSRLDFRQFNNSRTVDLGSSLRCGAVGAQERPGDFYGLYALSHAHRNPERDHGVLSRPSENGGSRVARLTTNNVRPGAANSCWLSCVY